VELMNRRRFGTALAGLASAPGFAIPRLSAATRTYHLRRSQQFEPGGPAMVLRAEAGAQLPEFLILSRAAMAGSAVLEQAPGSPGPEELRGRLFELRTYRTAPAGARALQHGLDALFPRAGILPVLHGAEANGLTYLIPFQDFAARDRAWTALTSDPDWIPLWRSFQSYQFGLFRAA
jgi:hypothetical protein